MRSQRKADALRDAAAIAARWKAGEMFDDIRVELGIGYHTLREIMQSVIPPDEYVRISHSHRVERCFSKGHRFKKGNVPWIKGKRLANPRRVPLGTVRIEKHYGKKKHGRGKVYRQRVIKVSHDHRRHISWIPLARYLWEKAHGPVPPGHIVAHEDGNTLNDDPGNLVLRSRAEQARYATTHCDQAARGRKISKTKLAQGADSRALRDFYRSQAERRANDEAEQYIEDDDWFDEEAA